MRRAVVVIALLCPASIGAQEAAGTLPEVPVLPVEEEARLAQTAAPAMISGNATVLVRTAGGLETWREGTNGYTCFVERFEQGNLLWPTCYEREAARQFVAINRLLEEYRAQGRTVDEYRTALADAYREGRIPVPQPGGISFRLSPEMRVLLPDGQERRGAWHVLIAVPYADFEDMGYARSEHMRVWEGAESYVSMQAPGRPTAYFWVPMQPLPDGLLAGSGE